MKQRYIFNFEEYKPLDVLSNFDDGRTLLFIALALYPRSSAIGLLEERRKMLRQIWDQVIAIPEEISGCSLSWAQLFFVTYAENEAKIINEFQEILKNVSNDSLRSFCVFGIKDHLSESMMKFFDTLQHEIASEETFKSVTPSLIKLLDGEIMR